MKSLFKNISLVILFVIYLLVRQFLHGTIIDSTSLILLHTLTIFALTLHWRYFKEVSSNFTLVHGMALLAIVGVSVYDIFGSGRNLSMATQYSFYPMVVCFIVWIFIMEARVEKCEPVPVANS